MTKFNLEAFESVEVLKDIYTKKSLTFVEDYKSTDDGINGKYFEICTKIIFRNVRNLKVSFNGKKDTYKKIGNKKCSFEIKTGSGEIATLDEEGNITDNHYFESDYIVYCKSFDKTLPLSEQVIVVASPKDFFEVFESEHLTRVKKSSSMYDKPESERYNDKLSFSTDGKRSKKVDRIITECIESGLFMTLEDFLKTY